MDFVNKTQFQAGWTLGFQPDGRELLVVAVKGTFSFPEDGEDPRPAEVQVPLTEADEFTGEPGLSATLYETDYAHRKPACDVLLNGSAYAPGGYPTEEVTVSLQVGSMKKAFRVVGNRVWMGGFLAPEPSSPEPFTQLPISYGCAYGGVDSDVKKPERTLTYLKNAVGVGYYPITKGFALDGKPLPSTEELGRRINSVKGTYQPMSFGPIGRNFESRIPFAGTYDEKWMSNRAPFFPDDFDYQYFQAAPRDQQIPYPSGGEKVVLENLTPQGLKVFRLPSVPMPILFLPYRRDPQQSDGVVDTIVIEPDLGRLMLTWRASLPLRRNCFEIMNVLVGDSLSSWRRAQRSEDKPHFASLAEYINSRRLARMAG